MSQAILVSPTIKSHSQSPTPQSPAPAKPDLDETPFPQPPRPNVDHIITEDDEPVDNIFSEKQQRLLTRALYSSEKSLTITKPFLVAANVGIFYGLKQPPIVPDVFLSLGVQVAEDWYAKEHRSYFVWEFGKLPELAIEIVSNKVGGEDSTKKERYARIGLPYYVIYDPQQLLSQTVLQPFYLDTMSLSYKPLAKAWFPTIELGLQLWNGEFEGQTTSWLRWIDEAGDIVPTGQEQAEQERQAKESAQEQAEQERQAKESAQQQTEQERQARKIAEERAEQYLAKLNSLGIELDE